MARQSGPWRLIPRLVREIALQAEDYRGDVVYAGTIKLPGVSGAPLRWGMTAIAEIETD